MSKTKNSLSNTSWNQSSRYPMSECVGSFSVFISLSQGNILYWSVCVKHKPLSCLCCLFCVFRVCLHGYVGCEYLHGKLAALLCFYAFVYILYILCICVLCMRVFRCVPPPVNPAGSDQYGWLENIENFVQVYTENVHTLF